MTDSSEKVVISSNENPFKALAKEFLKENPDMTVGDAVYIKTFAMWLDRRSQREPNSKPRCQICGTHEVDQTQTCHNSGCESYARGVTIYEGWRTHETGEPRDAIEAHVRQIQQLCDYSNLDPTQWLNDYTAQGEAAPAQKAVVKRCPKCNRDVTEGCNYCACPYPQATPSSEGSVGG